MRHPPRILLLILSSVFPLSLAAGADPTAHQSLTAVDGFGALLPCARYCFGDTGDCCGCDRVAAVLGCDYNCQGVVRGAANSCYCRADRIATANSYISSCVKVRCGGVGDYKVDLASASALYNGYCTGLGYFAAAPTASFADGGTSPNPTASGNGLPSNTGDVTAAGPTSSTSSTSSMSPAGQGGAGDLSDGAKAAIALGVILAVVLAGVVAFVAWRVRRRERRQFAGDVTAPVPPTTPAAGIANNGPGQVGETRIDEMPVRVARKPVGGRNPTPGVAEVQGRAVRAMEQASVEPVHPRSNEYWWRNSAVEPQSRPIHEAPGWARVPTPRDSMDGAPLPELSAGHRAGQTR